MALQKATFGAGCFWQTEEIYREVKGVKSTAVGYMGGEKKHPTYEDVCTDKTGHAEVVQVEFDPKLVDYSSLLKIFWDNHNPTTPNQQGPDFGTQYRSVIFFHSAAQETDAKKSIAELEKSHRFPRPIVTQIVPASDFWKAEDYHQQYLKKRGLASCHI